ncbi:hypothetical protein PF002_g27 [Phytophthora fragariae]|uniref:Uncharacterized protein n=1 Tax=Phytophthora fragariae TaxID=53985 RepID=A0A6A3MUJ9_9STRA|nr:hypothetical protein PF009_g335 [Phytophthora fragariae]KAE9031573.1 hypothetical protein PF011_g21 [Phytophthora fragariae]KAE9258516.1 hypothetical protein PF002_g27 [Phytophthora fragariae]KAE9329936.1 hypothetical protein PF001_g652 [Phytophthora fragariae]
MNSSFAEDATFLGRLAGGAGALSSRSEPESSSPSPAVFLGTPELDATVARFATCFSTLLASAADSPGTAFGVARLLVRSGAVADVRIAGAVVHGSLAPATPTTSGGATAAAAGGRSLSV